MADPIPALEGKDADRLIYGGVLGLAVAGALQLIDKATEESLPLTIAGLAFAVSLPLLAASLVGELVRTRRSRPEPAARWRQLVGLFATLTAIVGLAALFFHLGMPHGVLFLVSVALSALVVRSL